LSDVSKDKVAARQVESNTTQFTKTLESVESGLLKQINYLTTVSTGFLLFFFKNCSQTDIISCINGDI